MNKKVNLANWLNNLKVLEWLIIGAVFIALSISLVAAYRTRAYTSDDISTQNAMQTWSNGRARHVAQSTDTWVLKMPLYALDNVLMPHNSRLKVFIESFASSLVMLGGCLCFIRRVILRGVTTTRANLLLAYLPVAWFVTPIVSQATSGYSAARVLTLMNPNLRNAELGISLLLAVVFIDYFSAKSTNRFGLKERAGLGLLSLGLGLFVYNDPYFLYVFLVPGGLFAITYLLQSRLNAGRLMLAGLIGMCSLIFYLLLGQIGPSLGIETIDNIPRQLAPIAQLAPNLANTIHGLSRIFGADFWNYHLSWRILPGIAAAAVGLLAGLASLESLRRSSWLKYPATLFLALIITVNLGIYQFTTVNGSANERYMILAVLASIMLLAIWVINLRRPWLKLLVGVILGVGFMGNLALNSRLLVKHRHNNPNQLNYTIIDQVKKASLSKGYAAYWDANINTYLSNQNVHFLPVICDGYNLRKMKWLINKPEFNLPAQQTFYLYNATGIPPSVDACTPQLLSEHAGITPIKQIHINHDYTLYVYNGDIGQAFKYDPSFNN